MLIVEGVGVERLGVLEQVHEAQREQGALADPGAGGARRRRAGRRRAGQAAEKHGVWQTGLPQRGVAHRSRLPPELLPQGSATRAKSYRLRRSSTSIRARMARPRCDTRCFAGRAASAKRSEEHTSELQSQSNLVCRLLLEKKKKSMAW